VVTTSIWADVVDRVDCEDHFEVRTLIPAGGDPHAYEPSMQDRDVMADAALVVANGAGLEAQLADTLQTVADDGTPLLELADHVTTAAPHGDDEPDEPDESDEPDEHDDPAADEGHDHDGADPHIWFDPTLVIEALPALGDALVAAGAADAAIAECVATVGGELEDLDTEIATILAAVPEDRRVLVTNHDSLGYFARRYGFAILGSVLPSSSTLVETSPSELDDLADAIAESGVPAIFAEMLESTDDASALADRLGIEVVVLYSGSLGDADSGVTTYADLLRFNAEAIAAALGAGD
jgi:ABC-type Zn uptake system ZnuABC Zn-binding protein ZnuA